MIEKKKIPVPAHINGKRDVIVKYMGNIRQICISGFGNSSATILPLSKEEYLVLSSGEVRQIENHAQDRTGNVRNLQKTMRHLSDLINQNVTTDNLKQVRFITLTYKENMTDPEQLYKDFRDFNKRFRRYINKSGLQYEYIVCVEAQGRGAFHLHMIAIFSMPPPFIENSVLAKIWQHGYVNIKSLNGNIDNIGAYLTAYLSDVDIESSTALITTDMLKGDIKEVLSETGEKKHVIKGARLKMLPVGINIYRCSRGIKRPSISKMEYGEAIRQLYDDGFTKVYESAIQISDIERNFASTYISQIYKKHINPDFWCRDSEDGKQKTEKISNQENTK